MPTLHCSPSLISHCYDVRDGNTASTIFKVVVTGQPEVLTEITAELLTDPFANLVTFPDGATTMHGDEFKIKFDPLARGVAGEYGVIRDHQRPRLYTFEIRFTADGYDALVVPMKIRFRPGGKK